MHFCKIRDWLLMTCLIGGVLGVSAQISPDCGTAIPICSNTPVNGGTQGYGMDDFGGAAETGCLEQTLSGFIESNSAWYRFRTGASGQLGFNIGFDPQEDWDFALYRASGCGDLGEPVRCNFFDNSGQKSYMGVGEDPTGDTESLQYGPWLDVNAGEDYYLLINNFSNTNSGFSIQFTGQICVTNPYDALDCSIVSNLLGPPVAACQGDAVPLDATTTGAIEYRWFADTGSGFNLLAGENQPVLSVTSDALYRVQVNLSDGSQIISDVQVGFSPNPVAGLPTDVIECGGGGVFDLGTKDAEVLGSQSPSDFRISYHETAGDAQAGLNPLSGALELTPGTRNIYVRLTSAANPDCYDATSSFALEVVEQPVLVFQEEVFICSQGGSATLGPDQAEAGVQYQWDTGETSAALTVPSPGTYTLTATRTVSGFDCQAIRTVEVVASATPAIDRVDVSDLQKENRIEIIPENNGNFEYALNDGAYQSSPVFNAVPPGNHTVYMRDTLGCGEISEQITVVGFPLFFTPNGDGLNDRWEVFGLERLTDPVLLIFDRYGKLLRQLDTQSPAWDGSYQGRLLPAADYWFRLEYTDASGQRQSAQFLNAHFSLKR